MDGLEAATVIMVVLIGGAIVFSFCTGIFVDPGVAVKTLEIQGFSNVSIVEKDWLLVGLKGGGEGDVVKFTATATNPAGKQVTVAVFAGWPFKGATIRTP